MTRFLSARRLAAATLGASLAMSACSVPPPPTADQAAPTTSEPKILTIGMDRELSDYYGVTGSRAGAPQRVISIGLDTLVVQDAQEEWRPQLATEPISVDRGTWRINSDGTMNTVWKLRPNIKWHDGTPFTAEDFVFTVMVRRDPQLPLSGGRLDLVTSVSAPDPLTLTMRWSEIYVRANEMDDRLAPLPRHLLKDTYENQKEAFINSPVWGDLIGQGPYRLTHKEPGSHMIFDRFEDYYGGRPPLDRVVLRVLGDENAMVTSILAGAVDVLVPTTVKFEAALEIQRQWAGTGNIVAFTPSGSVQHIEIQFRPDVARPKEGLTNLPTRQAFYHAIDRGELVSSLTSGLGTAADHIWVSPASSRRSALEPLIPQYPYDPQRAQQLLASAGWIRGPDRVLANGRTSERFETELRGPGPDARLVSVVSDMWKQAGAVVEETIIPAARLRDQEYVSKFEGGSLSSSTRRSEDFRFHSSGISAQSNRWSGPNRSGYSNPAFDSLLERSAATVTPADRSALDRQLVRSMMEDVIVMPLYWELEATIQSAGIRSEPIGLGKVWNFMAIQKII